MCLGSFCEVRTRVLKDILGSQTWHTESHSTAAGTWHTGLAKETKLCFL